MLQLILYIIFKVVQEYERAVIFRLGRLMQGGAKGPGKQFHFLEFITKKKKKNLYFIEIVFLLYIL